MQDRKDLLTRCGVDSYEALASLGLPPETPGLAPYKHEIALFGKLDYSTMYTTVYTMCTQKSPHNWSEELYKRYGVTIEQYLQRNVLPALLNLSGVALLEALRKQWECHELYTKWLERFFTYLDRFYVKLVADARPLSERGVTLFEQTIFRPKADAIREAFLSCMADDRDGRTVDANLLRTITKMLLTFGLGSPSKYQQELEAHILPATAEYYAEHAGASLSTETFAGYLEKAHTAIEVENERCERYLHAESTHNKLQSTVIDVLLRSTRRSLLEKDTGIVYLLKNNKRTELKRAYEMFSLVDDGLAPIAAIFKEYVTEQGLETIESKLQTANLGSLRQKEGAGSSTLVNDKTMNTIANDLSFIQSMIDLHVQFKVITQECFRNTFLFQKALREGFETVVNRDVGKTSFAFLLSTFCDRLMKRTGSTDAEAEYQLARVTELFAFLADKDVFADIYRYQLARRLLSETSTWEDLEKTFISKLKMKCGANFTLKLEGMISDLHAAADVQEKFQKHVKTRFGDATTAMAGIDFSAQVLTTGHWPTYPSADVCLPPQLSACLEHFAVFYAQDTQHRRLTWIHLLGNAMLTRHFVKRHDIYCNTYQACILLLFNTNSHALTSADIANALNLEETFTRKLIGSAHLSKFKILKKQGDSADKQIKATDPFTVDEEFSFPNRRIKLPVPVPEETSNKERVEIDRSTSIDAAIVRVMKTRKKLGHNQLLSEVINLLTFFKPTPKKIKERIEHLIEKEYLERDPNNLQNYEYKA
eukprot:Polyplicarium_translucidae@DN2397_c0_g1_i1.p1